MQDLILNISVILFPFRTLLKEKLEAFLLTNKKLIDIYIIKRSKFQNNTISIWFRRNNSQGLWGFLTGGFLIKPNLNHLETWPNLFVENKFFKSHKWDLSDLNEIIDFV